MYRSNERSMVQTLLSHHFRLIAIRVGLGSDLLLTSFCFCMNAGMQRDRYMQASMMDQ